MAETVADTRRLITKPQNLNDAYGPPSNFLEIDVSNPQTVGVGRGRFTTYEIRVKVRPSVHPRSRRDPSCPLGSPPADPGAHPLGPPRPGSPGRDPRADSAGLPCPRAGSGARIPGGPAGLGAAEGAEPGAGAGRRWCMEIGTGVGLRCPSCS